MKTVINLFMVTKCRKHIPSIELGNKYKLWPPSEKAAGIAKRRIIKK